MEIFVLIKFFKEDTKELLKPLVLINEVKHIDVFRFEKGYEMDKVTFITSKNGNKFPILYQLQRIWQMFRFVNKKTRIIIGVYEYPHGLISVLMGWLLRKPSVVCIVSNPDYKARLKGFKKILFNFVVKNATIVTTTGTISKQKIINRGVNNENVFPLMNSIDIDYFKPKNIEKKYDIISVGRLSEEKRVDTMLKIISLLKKDFPQIKMAIGGSGQEKERLKKIVKELEIEKNVDFLGFIPDDEEFINFYNSGKLYLLTSDTEGCPRTVSQAMSCGIPCISRNVGDIEDLIENKISGIIIDYNATPDEYVKEIKELLSNHEKYKRISDASIKRVEEKFSHKAVSRTWENIFIKLDILKH